MPCAAVITVTIGSQRDIDEAAAKHAVTSIAEMANFANGKPAIQIDEIAD